MIPAFLDCLLRIAQQAALHAELQPGDALYIPEGWWHQVDSTGQWRRKSHASNMTTFSPDDEHHDTANNHTSFSSCATY
jgi:hypothetical protein